MAKADLLGDVEVSVVTGPYEYLFGEETALLEVIDGRPPLPRIAPPYRRGVVEVVEHDDDVASGSGSSAHVEMAGPDHETSAPPALVDNVETLANVAHIVAEGAAWFRELGTEASPGTIVCTVTGDVVRPGVGEIPLGTSVREAIDVVAGGPDAEHPVKAVLNGVSGAPLPAALLDTPLTYEDMAGVGSGLGTASLIVVGEGTDMTAVAAGAARFLAVESCGQCTPCKVDGLVLADALDRLCAGSGAQHRPRRRHQGTGHRRRWGPLQPRQPAAGGGGGDPDRMGRRGRPPGDGGRPRRSSPTSSPRWSASTRRATSPSTKGAAPSSPTGPTTSRGRARTRPTSWATTPPATTSTD